MDMLFCIFNYFSLILLLYSLKLLLFLFFQPHSSYIPRLNSTFLLNLFLLPPLSVLLKLHSLPDSFISTLLPLLLSSAFIPYCLLLMYCCTKDLPLPPILDGETDHAPRPVHTRSSLIPTIILPKHRGQLQQAILNKNHLPRRGQQVRFPSLLPVLSQNQRLSLRLRLIPYHHTITYYRTNHFHIFSDHPLAMEQRKLLHSQSHHATHHCLSPVLLTKHLFSKAACTASTYSTCTLPDKHTHQHTNSLLLQNHKYNSFQHVQYILVQNSLSTSSNVSAQIHTNRLTNMRIALQIETTSNSKLPSQHLQKKKPTCCDLLCYDPPNSPRHLVRYTSSSTSTRLCLTTFCPLPMSIYSSISRSPTSQPSIPSRLGTPLYRKALISDPPDESKEITEVILSGWIRTNTTVTVGQDVVLHLTNGLTGSRVTDPHARIHIISQKIREPSTRDQPTDNTLFSTYQGLQGYAFLGLSASLKDYVLDWPISHAQFASKSSISFFCHPMPGCIAKPFATYSVEYILILPPLLDHRLAWHIALNYFTKIATQIGLLADDFIVTPGPPGAPDTPTKTFCFITRHQLSESTRNAVLSLGASAPDFEDDRTMDTDGKAILNGKFTCHTLTLYPGTDNLSRLTQHTRSAANSYLWLIIHGYEDEVTSNYLTTVTGVETFTWIQTTKYGEYLTIIAPTDEAPKLAAEHPQIFFSDKPPVTITWTVLSATFPNDYHLGRGRIESYLGSSPPHFIYNIPSSGDPKDVNQDLYIYFPDPLRVTLFANLSKIPASNTIRAVPQVVIPTPPPSVRSNPKALKLSYAPPTSATSSPESTTAEIPTKP